MKSTDYFPDCDEEYEINYIECWIENGRQVLHIMDNNPVTWSDCRFFQIGTVFVCMEQETNS